MTPATVSDFDWDRHEQNWNAWWAGELRRPLVMIEQPVRFREARELTREFLFETPIEQVLTYFDNRLANTRYHGDAWPKWFPFFGAGIVAGFLGAEVHFAPLTETIWFEPSAPASIRDLRPALDPDNPWWQRVQALTRAAVAHWGNRVVVAHTDLGGNCDILASLLTTQQLLFDLYDAPTEVARLTAELTRLWLDCYDRLHGLIAAAGRGTSPWAAIWSPGRCYMLQSDFSYMISPEMFEQFVLPDLAACCDRLDHAFFHMDGKGQIRHLEMLLSLERLRGIQWIPGDGQPPPEEWLPLLKRIRDGGKLCQLYVSAAGALKITRELGGQGFAFYINDTLSPNEADDLLRTLAEL